jgi:hypothetical protein
MDDCMDGHVGLIGCWSIVILVVDNNRRFVDTCISPKAIRCRFNCLLARSGSGQGYLFRHHWTVVALYYWVRELLWRRPRIGKTWSLVQFFEVFLHVGVLLLPVEVYHC